jgi:subtilisin-like proprotein convertase family protein
VLTGIFEPDGRIEPVDSVRTSLLDVFNGRAGNGEWRLAVGDLSENGQMQLVDWSLTFTGTSIPEPSAFALMGLGMLALFVRKPKQAS